MSDDILGYDCQGEALRAGDRVEVVRSFSGQCVGRRATALDRVPSINPVTRVLEDGILSDIANPLDPHGGHVFDQSHLRRINSGRDIFEKARDRALTEGNPDAQRSEPTTTERAQAWISGQPWTEPSR